MIDPYKVKMMPGQEPYTRKELDRLYEIVGEVAALGITEDDELILSHNQTERRN